ncbi:glycosyltransferase [Propioniciclava sp. MC1595]|uniref:glycosyltransferase n=1 Tax=Propioniciclava sp. MC1595 TaxID=2760308 RepID=UPI00166280B0|nr:glycosyltransferase [Propioniciclava sp. MC1595]MBB1494624.1 glycosyltransferase [Propioniciclava sp. MC1595]QTE27384.1 glycosyltransferase [Propioniciclava sp. MC1595]
MTETLLAPTADAVPLDLAVIIPSHNVADTLGDQLDALTAERWTRPWGIVVVDNRSTDATRAVAEGYADRGVRVVVADARGGVAYARNSGVRAVDAKAVAFCDGDDVVQPGWVKAMGEALDQADIVSGYNDTTVLNPAWLAATRPGGTRGQLSKFGRVPFASGGNGGMRKSLFERLAGYDEDFVGLEDIEFSLRAHSVGARFAAADAVISYRYRHDLKDLWKQGRAYGRGRPVLAEQARSLGLDGPKRHEGLRSWAWLLVHAPDLRHKTGRFKWVWVLANRIGVIEGALHARILQL